MRGKKTSEEDKEKLKAVVYLNPTASQRDIAKQANMPLTTVHEFLKDETFIDKDEFEQLRTEKKQEFISGAWEVVQKALKLANKRFDKALEKESEFDAIIDEINSDDDMTKTQKQALISKLSAVEMANIKDIAIALGTIYDKQALASGEPTQISESRKPLGELMKETEEYLKELKQLTGS